MKNRIVFGVALVFINLALLSGCGDETGMPLQVTGSPAPTMTLGPQSYRGKLTITSVHPSLGVVKEMTISESGEVTILDKGSVLSTTQLSPDQLSQLRTTLQVSRFFDLESIYGRANAPFDIMNTVTLETADRKKSVSIAEQNIPGIQQKVRDIFRFVLRVYYDARPAPTPHP